MPMSANMVLRIVQPIFIVAAVVGSVVPAAAGQPLSDAQIEKLVVGKWRHEESENDAVTEYRDDGTFTDEGMIERIEGPVKIRVSGRWLVRDGAVVEVVQKCDPAGIQPGTTRYDTALELDANKFRYRTEQGVVRVKTRV